MVYLAMIGDIVGSRSLQDRAGVQRKLKETLAHINDVHADAIASKFIVTLGDEFQGLLHDASRAVVITEAIWTAMHPVKIRFGMGVGAIATDVDPERAIGADGPCYHLARRAIGEVHAEERKNRCRGADMKILADGGDERFETVNALLVLMSRIRARRTDRQIETIRTLEACGGNQGAAAEALGVARSTVVRSLESADYYATLRARDAIEGVLKRETFNV